MRAERGCGAKEWAANIIPGVSVIPSGTWGVNRAHAAGCSYCAGGRICPRTPTCGYVDNASALPTDPQDQKTKASVNLIASKLQQVRHNPTVTPISRDIRR